MMLNRSNAVKAEMFLFLKLFLACGITFHSSYGLDLKYRKQIYDKYVSSNSFQGEWVDPHSLGIFDESLEFKEDSYTVYSEEIMSNKEGTREAHKTFSRQRILSKNKSQDGWGFGDIFLIENNTIFALVRNLMTVSALLTAVIFILLLFFPKSLIFSFVLILSISWHWMKLYQEKIAEKQNLTENLRHPNECRRADLHWYEIIYLYLSSYASAQTDCREYYKARLVDPFWEVSLPMAMINAFSNTICEPLKVFATTLRFCFEVIFSGLTVLQLSIILFSIFIFLLMHYGYSFSFCWGAISLYRSRSSADQTGNRSLSFWGTIAKHMKALFFRDSALIRPSEINIPPDCKNITFPTEEDKVKDSEIPNEIQKDTFSSEDDKVKVSEIPNEFQEEEESTNCVRQNAVLPSVSLHSKRNRTIVALKVSKYKKYRKNRSILKARCQSGGHAKSWKIFVSRCRKFLKFNTNFYTLVIRSKIHVPPIEKTVPLFREMGSPSWANSGTIPTRHKCVPGSLS